jgi:ABC-type polysaccharide/polyol phosphate export permease
MTVIFQRSTPDFPLFLLSAMVPFKWFTATIGNSTGAITGKEGLIKQILFPKLILPVTLSLSQVVSWLFGMLVLAFVLVVVYADHLTLNIIFVPLIAAVQYTFVLGITFLVSSITVFYRDVGIVIGHFMKLLFWVSPILWSFAAVAGRGQRLANGLLPIDRSLGLPEGTLFGLLANNPVAVLLDSYRGVIYGQVAPDIVGSLTWIANGQVAPPIQRGLTWIPATPPDFGALAAIFVAGIVIIVIGTLVFKRLEPAFAKVL